VLVVQAIPDNSAVLLHACAHNPTGVDLQQDQWRELSALMKQKNHIAFFDCAYQGFASGDADRDAFAVRHFVDEGHNIMLCQSFSKNFGLYGERTGALSVVGADAEEMQRAVSQLKILVRPMFSNPPIYGARIVETILKDAALKEEWERDCKHMADRINAMRDALVAALEQRGSQRSWKHVQEQIGMFCYTGLSADECGLMRNKHSVYLPDDGRVSMAGVTTENVEYLADAIHDVTK